jgi:hypothetical protein
MIEQVSKIKSIGGICIIYLYVLATKPKFVCLVQTLNNIIICLV